MKKMNAEEEGFKKTRKSSLSKGEALTIKLRKEIQSHSYEETLERIDKLLENLQNEDVLLEEIQESYLKGKIYIQHCEELLNQLEQSVSEIEMNDAN